MTAQGAESEHVDAYVVPCGGKPGYYVFWATANAYGSRGSVLTREAAEALAQSVREGGPNAL